MLGWVGDIERQTLENGTFRTVLFTGSHIMVLIVVPVVGLALAWFLRRTAAGTAIRAALTPLLPPRHGRQRLRCRSG